VCGGAHFQLHFQKPRRNTRSEKRSGSIVGPLSGLLLLKSYYLRQCLVLHVDSVHMLVDLKHSQYECLHNGFSENDGMCWMGACVCMYSTIEFTCVSGTCFRFW
jgi:hypothetical protein